MYGGHYSRRNGSFFQAFFWVLVGFLIGQIIRLDIQVLPRNPDTSSIQTSLPVLSRDNAE